MAKAAYSEEFSEDDKKQMDAMRESDRSPPEPAEIKPEPVEPEIKAEEPEVVAEEKPVKNSMVPHAALHEEREARKAAEREARELKEQFARFDERRKVLEELQKPQKVKETAPDPDKDALGALKYTQRELESLRAAEVRREQENNQRNQMQQVAYRAASLEQEFASKAKDYGEASEFVLNSRLRELKAFGNSDAEARNILEQEKFNLAAQALQRGQNPAEIVYNLAKERGYAAKPSIVPDDKIAQLEKSQRANTSLSNVSGTSSINRGPSAKEIAAMDDDEFTKYTKTLTRAQQRALYGD